MLFYRATARQRGNLFPSCAWRISQLHRDFSLAFARWFLDLTTFLRQIIFLSVSLRSSIPEWHFSPAGQYPVVLCDILPDIFLLPEMPVSHFAFPVCTIKSIYFHIKMSFLHLYHHLNIGHVSPKLLFCLRYSEQFESFLSHDKSA